MGIPFQISLQHLFERVSLPLHAFLHPAAHQWTDEHALKWQCYASGQMSDVDLEKEVAADPAFGDYVKSREAIYH